MNKTIYLGIIALSASIAISCGEKTPQAGLPAASGETAKPTAANAMEKAEYETTSSVKLRKSPSTTAELAKCKVEDVSCHSSQCTGETSVLSAGETVHASERTGVLEKISGAEGYWYKLDKSKSKCEAWVFGGFLKLIYSEADAGKAVTLHDPKVKGDRDMAQEKCKALKMKLAGKSELIRGFKSGSIKVTEGEGNSGEFWYLRPSGHVAMLNLPGGTDLIPLGATEAEFRCVK